MNQEIMNPYKVKHRMYLLIMLISVLAIVISFAIDKPIISGLFGNLGYGCFASTLVAYLIDIKSTEEKNQKANDMYRSAYIGLKCRIREYIIVYAQLQAIAFEIEGQSEKHTWIEWYEILKSSFSRCDEERKRHLMSFFEERTQYVINQLMEEIELIQRNESLFEINDIINAKLKSIIENIRIEFLYFDFKTYAEWYFKTTDADSGDSINDRDTIWKFLDAINKDMEKYISDWSDISFYNRVLFSPDDLFWKEVQLNQQ